MEIRERNRALKAKTLKDFFEKCNVSGDAAWESREEFDFLKTKLSAAAASEEEEPEGAKPGQELVIAGVIGKAGTCFLGKYRKEKLLTKLPKAFIELGEAEVMTKELVIPEELSGLLSWEVGEGGMYRTLNEIAKTAKGGFVVDYCKVPVSQVTIEFCEVFELDPWQMLSGGCVIFAADRGSDVIRVLEAAGIPCALIGLMSSDNDKVIAHRETRSLLNRPQPDEILKVLKEELRAEEA